jgi:hypothetical protein
MPRPNVIGLCSDRVKTLAKIAARHVVASTRHPRIAAHRASIHAVVAENACTHRASRAARDVADR